LFKGPHKILQRKNPRKEKSALKERFSGREECKIQVFIMGFRRDGRFTGGGEGGLENITGIKI
jgi:hypothetical protein